MRVYEVITAACCPPPTSLLSWIKFLGWIRMPLNFPSGLQEVEKQSNEQWQRGETVSDGLARSALWLLATVWYENQFLHQETWSYAINCSIMIAVLSEVLNELRFWKLPCQQVLSPAEQLHKPGTLCVLNKGWHFSTTEVVQSPVDNIERCVLHSQRLSRWLKTMVPKRKQYSQEQ